MVPEEERSRGSYNQCWEGRKEDEIFKLGPERMRGKGKGRFVEIKALRRRQTKKKEKGKGG